MIMSREASLTLGGTKAGYRNWTLDIELKYRHQFSSAGFSSSKEYRVKISAERNGEKHASISENLPSRYNRETEVVGDPSLIDRLLGRYEERFVGTNADDAVARAIERVAGRIDEFEENIESPTTPDECVPLNQVLPVSGWADVLRPEDTEGSDVN